MSKTFKSHWPDEVRLKMIEKSEFYSEPQVYQYGFYDGFRHAQSQTQELQEQNAELVEMLTMIKDGINKMDFCQLEILYDDISEILTKHNHLNKK